MYVKVDLIRLSKEEVLNMVKVYYIIQYNSISYSPE